MHCNGVGKQWTVPVMLIFNLARVNMKIMKSVNGMHCRRAQTKLARPGTQFW